MNGLFDTQGFLPPRLCGTWTSGLQWTHILSEGAMCVAHTLITLILLFYWKRQRARLPFPWFALLFALCFFLGGLTHACEAIAWWIPAYRFFGLIKLLAALASLGTVLAVLWVAPEAFEMFIIRVSDIRQMAELARMAHETEQALRSENCLLREQLKLQEPRDGRVSGSRSATDLFLSG